jgi:hypothetical protein
MPTNQWGEAMSQIVTVVSAVQRVSDLFGADATRAVSLRRPVNTENGQLPIGAVGTVVRFNSQAQTYEVNYLQPFHANITVEADAIEEMIETIPGGDTTVTPVFCKADDPVAAYDCDHPAPLIEAVPPARRS